jgi:hypothetical protein
MLALGDRHARLAVTPSTLEHRLAAHRARARIRRPHFNLRRAPCSRRVWPRLRGLARRCEQRRSLRSRHTAPIFRFGQNAARRCAERFAERLCEARRDRPQAFAPMRQRQCELMRQRCREAANQDHDLEATRLLWRRSREDLRRRSARVRVPSRSQVRRRERRAVLEADRRASRPASRGDRRAHVHWEGVQSPGGGRGAKPHRPNGSLYRLHRSAAIERWVRSSTHLQTTNAGAFSRISRMDRRRRPRLPRSSASRNRR